MKPQRYLVVAGALFALSACQYKAEPPAIGAFNVYSSYDQKLKGRYLLYVEGGQLNRDVSSSVLECSAHTYPLALSASFVESTRQTLANLVEELQLVDKPVGREVLAAQGARGMIIVRGENVIGRLNAIPKAFTSDIETDVEIIASITVDGRDGRLLGSTVSGRAVAKADAGAACEGGAKSLAQSAGDAMRQTLTKLGEALTNSERIRKGA